MTTFTILGFLIPTTFAQNPYVQYCSFMGCGSGASFLVDVFARAGFLVQSLVSGACVLVIIYGGIRLSLGGADESSKAAGKNTIKWGLIGLLLAVIVLPIIRFVINVF